MFQNPTSARAQTIEQLLATYWHLYPACDLPVSVGRVVTAEVSERKSIDAYCRAGGCRSLSRLQS